MIFSGLLDLPWWGYLLCGLGLTHVTIAAVTIYLHRCQAHRALELHPAVSHFFRFWLWLTTGMVTKEWAAIHRKHHAKCETVEDPHSPQVYGINRVLWGGVFLYVKESHNQETMERYGHGTPDDWMERNVYSHAPTSACRSCSPVYLLLFGLVPGALIWLMQIAWIPFWAAGVINGVGHFCGYRNLRRRRRQHQHRPVGHPDRRRGAAQQPPRLRDLGQAVGEVVRVRHRLDVHPPARVARPGHGEEGGAEAALRPSRSPRPTSRRCTPSSPTATTCCRATPSR